ncbi:hypothetical protein R1flu_023984 [Riccia fluitans]|uniref:Uncharacterized protein n=1 Tax=Riccia fluitans TaxID=41844 RepID=A0ABD1XTK3_9MARC
MKTSKRLLSLPHLRDPVLIRERFETLELGENLHGMGPQLTDHSTESETSQAAIGQCSQNATLDSGVCSSYRRLLFVMGWDLQPMTGQYRWYGGGPLCYGRPSFHHRTSPS